MERWAIVVAGGSGQRMGSELPKQFLTLGGKPILVHTLELFLQCLSSPEKIRLVIPPSHFPTWNSLAPDHLKQIPLIPGGSTRYESVKNGLNSIPASGVVAIHDGVRPLASENLIMLAYSQAENKGSAIPLVPLNDSLRYSNNNHWEAFDRNLIRAVQTPQVFSTSLLMEAYQNTAYSEHITDDTMVFEKAGFIPHFIPGERENIKITTPIDLVTAEAILQQNKRS